jgi:phosphoglycolate phosphatase
VIWPACEQVELSRLDGPMPTTDPSNVVILWDVDGTLIKHAPAMDDRHARAASHAMGQKAEKISTGLGYTDRQILVEIMQNSGAEPTAAMVTIAMAELDAMTRSELAIKPATAITGVQEVLEELRNQGTRQLLLTGNTPARSEIKVASAGLGEYFDFADGFYGDVASNRFELTERARTALDAEQPISEQHLIIVGDTALDIHAARHASMRVIAVATGIHSADDLQLEEPDLLLQDFSNDGHLLNAYVTTLMTTLGR